MTHPTSTYIQRTVLVVDDDRMIRLLARDALEPEGYTVLEASGGAEAIDVFERHRPDLVLLDITMPEIDGYSVCTEIRRRHPGDPTPIVMVTAKGDHESIDRAYEAGATDFVTKPVNAALLGHRVRYLLRVRDAMVNLKRNELSLADAQRIAHIGSFEWYSETNDMSWSEETFRILGRRPDGMEANHRTFLGCVHPDDRDRVREVTREALDHGKGYAIEHRVLRPDEEVRHVRQIGEVVPVDPSGMPWLRGTLQDVTEQQRAEEQIRYLASYDSLTGLANRCLFKERLGLLLERARERGSPLGLLYMDLDRFKRVNDTLGHSAGDQLRRRVADALRRHVRESDVVARVDTKADPEDADVSRLGGDAFTVVLSEIASPEAAGDVARRILESVTEIFDLEGHEISTTGSIGIAIFPDDGEDVETLLRHADTAMCHAKKRGRDNYQFSCQSMNDGLQRKLEIEARLRPALEQRQLKLQYQPKLDLRTDAVSGMEALLRWRDAELGVVAPRELISVAEESSLIHPLGAWILEEACTQNAAWQSAGYQPVPVGVNVSAVQFSRGDICASVSLALQRSRLDPQWLEIEITESILLQDGPEHERTLYELKAMGVRIALDNFGTGNSSLSYLTRIPFDTLKLDRSFIRDVESDSRSKCVMPSVIAMAHSVGARIVAEGVDSEEQESFLRSHGCDEIQGFLFSASLAPEDFVRFLPRQP